MMIDRMRGENMTKHYCDRCGKEANSLTKNKIPNEVSSRDTYQAKEVELCNECNSELKKFENSLLPAIINLKIAMYKNFMNK